jgi:MoaA/NifB/PqqE/SkfB family radical SAM enzyme
MTLTGLHLLLTYECTSECDHCFVWSSPRQAGTLSIAKFDRILEQAVEFGSIEWMYFEGGEPFLYYATLRHAVLAASARGLKVGIVTNSYWATGAAEARAALRDLAGHVQDLSVSADTYHGGAEHEQRAGWVREAALELGMPCDPIRIAEPGQHASAPKGKLPAGVSPVMFRGRAAAKLADAAPQRPWAQFTSCPYENLRAPGRVHVDPFGNVHLCQGLLLGNLFEQPLKELCRRYVPEEHPVVGPILFGGPALLARRYAVPNRDTYADACHMCDDVRRSLRPRFAALLAPDQMYGAAGG